MTDSYTPENADCPRFEIAAYLDGVLEPREEIELERHLATCPACAAELNEQKRMFSALDFALDDRVSVEVPENFTKVVVANAESSVRGLRCPRERNRALFVCLGLFLIGIVGLGAETSRTVASFGALSEQFIAVGGFFVHLVHNLSVSTTFLLRSFFLQVVFKSSMSVAMAVLIFGCSLIVFSRLLLKGRKV